ncbi:MAG: hydantoinase/oxoprolinase family protein [Rhodospirillales bacterium]|nr:hydantoinase/oxoprolinase family protein [Rhodospirillales bacterium]MDH3965497.1 hydantoinase/oxoprolinase family protein [Rhodospirillales bacterium]
MIESGKTARLAIDIGGTFTDLALEAGDRLATAKVLTTPARPDEAVLEGIAVVMAEAGVRPGAVGLIIHGTTLATNALIERKGARTALVTTEGHRDSLEMAYENRFEQYDINIDRPEPLVPRYLRWPLPERLNARGEVLRPLDEVAVSALVPRLEAEGIESLAVGLLHAYANPAHEERVAGILRAALPDLWISLSSEVCPEIREYERLSTTCANAYVQPLMARYLTRLEQRLREDGFACPFLLMTSGGGLTGFETAVRFPIRLVESGPAGGAILASRIAAECAFDRVLSFDMGGTTAKICLIDDQQPLTSRSFEVARAYRFMRGSGLPLRIPAIEMVEIGAGGGSIASVDALKRVAVGPESAGAEPGPACYGRGGEAPTVTDADLVLGRIDPEAFAGGSMTLAPQQAAAAVSRGVGAALDLDDQLAAFAISEVVDENMANAARVHAVEWGKEVAGRTLIAFGGAAPLHAARLAKKLGLERIVVPADAGVGSAIGFLCAPIAYEVVRSRYHRLSAFDPALVNRTLEEMSEEAHAVVCGAAPEAVLGEVRTAYMRYIGQGHEIAVDLPVRPLRAEDGALLREAFDTAYTSLYGRTIPGLDIEVLSWTVTVATRVPEPRAAAEPEAAAPPPEPAARRPLFDPERAGPVSVPVYRRAELGAGMCVEGPALIVEDQTTTVVAEGFTAAVNDLGYITMTRHREEDPR